MIIIPKGIRKDLGFGQSGEDSGNVDFSAYGLAPCAASCFCFSHCRRTNSIMQQEPGAIHIYIYIYIRERFLFVYGTSTTIGGGAELFTDTPL